MCFHCLNGGIGLLMSYFASGLKMKSVELEVVKKRARDLEIALKDNFTPIINDLRSEGLIKDSTYKRVQDTRLQLTQEERAGELVRSVEDAVQLSSANYFKFVKILSGNGVAHLYKDILILLQSTLCGEFFVLFFFLPSPTTY